jgi:hypothetical protein
LEELVYEPALFYSCYTDLIPMDFFITTIQHWIQTAGALGVFGASIAEELISPIPSSMVQMGAGDFIKCFSAVNAHSIEKHINEISITAELGVKI